MSNYKPMTATWTVVDDTTRTIEVRHDPRQSYSRAVQPKAFRLARQVLRGVWALTDVDHGPSLPADWYETGYRSVTTYTFQRVAVGGRIPDAPRDLGVESDASRADLL